MCACACVLRFSSACGHRLVDTVEAKALKKPVVFYGCHNAGESGTNVHRRCAMIRHYSLTNNFEKWILDSVRYFQTCVVG